MSGSKVFTSLTLPNGTVLKNRIAKAAMEESLAHVETSTPSPRLMRLYKTWAEGGCGLIITGHVMVGRQAMAGPGDICLDDDRHLTVFRKWAGESQRDGCKVWMQINHPGRQMRNDLGQQAWAPSAIAVNVGGLASKFLAIPKEMKEDQIHRVIEQFTITAQLAEQAGFDGVEVHAAHGYLLSQFLSPLSNQRTDSWGGSLDNRAKLLYNVVRCIRDATSPAFTVAVKLNSADFQRGGFSESDAQDVVKVLNTLGVDVIELSGGSFETPVMGGSASRTDSTLAREAYFLEFAKAIVAISKVPIMLTGGISRRSVMDQVLEAQVDIVGMATALALVPDLPRRIENGDQQIPKTKVTYPGWSNRTLAAAAQTALIKWYMRNTSLGKRPNYEIWPSVAIIIDTYLNWTRVRRFNKRIKSCSPVSGE